jgi:uncharacterized protein (TIGR00661 family)
MKTTNYSLSENTFDSKETNSIINLVKSGDKLSYGKNVKLLEKAFAKLPEQHFHWFLNTVKTIETIGNITYYPVNQEYFNESIINCQGIITGGGFETPAEALYLRKKILSIPILNHYEQECNAAALKKMGVSVVYEIGNNFELIIENWLNTTVPIPEIESNNILETLQFLFDTYHNI